jgi:trehalose 6-phosphate phosphatase
MDEIESPSLFLDFDGTLVEIADGPDAIEPPGALGRRLETLANRFDGRVAVVTGRSLDNLHHFLGPSATFRAGSHGAHIEGPDREVLREARPLPDDAISTLADFAKETGLLYERKTHGGALHYRSNPAMMDQVLSIAEQVGEQHGLAVKQGKSVAELVWPGADKGGAVRILMAKPPFAGSVPVFLGDDVTDEDGMAAAREHDGFGIAVGERPFTNASYHLPTVKDVYEWLKL